MEPAIIALTVSIAQLLLTVGLLLARSGKTVGGGMDVMSATLRQQEKDLDRAFRSISKLENDMYGDGVVHRLKSKVDTIRFDLARHGYPVKDDYQGT